MFAMHPMLPMFVAKNVLAIIGTFLIISMLLGNHIMLHICDFKIEHSKVNNNHETKKPSALGFINSYQEGNHYDH